MKSGRPTISQRARRAPRPAAAGFIADPVVAAALGSDAGRAAAASGAQRVSARQRRKAGRP